MRLPKLFYNTVKDLPFSACSKCDRFLLQDGVEYMIEKVCIPNDVLYEFAICHFCLGKVQKEISEESLKNMEAFQEKEMNSGIQMIDGMLDFGIDKIKQILNNKHPGINYESCNIVGYFNGTQVMPHSVLCASTQALENMQDVISKKTRDSFDDFTDFLGGIPPDLEELFKVRPRILI